MSRKNVNRRTFLKGAAAGAAALSLSAASYARVYKANERIGVGFVGVGGRCQAHLDIVAKLQKENKGVAAVAVCDVWDGHEEDYEVVGKDGKKSTRHYGQGLKPSAKKVGINHDDKKHVAKAQTSYYRNSNVGQWRYYRLYKEMNPGTINWDMFLGHDFEVIKGVPLGPSPKETPFDRAVFGQWRCYWPFGGGMFTDLFVH